MEEKNTKANVLVCTSIWYYSRKDEDAFFEWLSKIECIESFECVGENIYLEIASDVLHDQDLRDLLAIFYRYKIEMTQLKRFLTDDNRKWFYENKKGYWHRRVFGK